MGRSREERDAEEKKWGLGAVVSGRALGRGAWREGDRCNNFIKML
jgi:hypothetical protein